MANEFVKKVAEEKYKFGFTTDVHTEIIDKGLNEDVIRLISSKKGEPDWLLEFRLQAFRYWQEQTQPTWGHLRLPEIDYQAISYYADPTKKKDKSENKEIDPELMKTFDKLGIPLEERLALSGTAVDAVMDSVSVKTTFLMWGFRPIASKKSIFLGASSRKEAFFRCCAAQCYDMFANLSTALVKSLMVLSTSPCSIPSLTQCWICPSSTICPHLCSADLAALIWERISSQGTSSSIILLMEATCPSIFLSLLCRLFKSIHCFISLFLPDLYSPLSYSIRLLLARCCSYYSGRDRSSRRCAEKLPFQA